MSGAVAAGRAKGRGSKSRPIPPRERRPIAASPAGAAVGPVADGARSQTPSWFAHLVEMASEHVLAIQVGTLLLLTAIVYGHTLDVPFYLDDYPSIQENPTVYLWDGSLRAIISQQPLRWITYLSFALNYRVNAFQSAGYHIFNIVIHAINGLLVFRLVYCMLRTPALRMSMNLPMCMIVDAESASTCGIRDQDQESPTWMAFFSAAFFLIHPLHTQAVTYIVQRAASLASLFYLSSMVAYLEARLAQEPLRRYSWAGICLLSMLCAFFTKQNTATLPAALVLLELVFWKTTPRKLVFICFGGLFSLFAAWVLFTSVLHLDPFSIQSMAEISQETKSISRQAYLMTQFRVLWTYLRLYIYPVGQCLDYQGYPIYQTFWQTAVLYSFLGHVLLMGIGMWCFRRYPMVAFGIFFIIWLTLSSRVCCRSAMLPSNTALTFRMQAYP
ncbi:hypothetical protein [Desulfatirhabdium butyrativorans]|uniref:hypothetical protein n=1 Tax=Desulfatirhabdium butyrativorans TaxID=340467 RepID=UPI0004182EE0|nr:hypothetical protein [Desulfatirhabdium butyrativorans]